MNDDTRADNVIKWVEALEYGKYKQGKGELHNVHDDSYCCLGVAVECLKLPNEDELVLDKTSQDALGLTSYAGDIKGGWAGEEGLVDLNDSGRYSFEHIAAIIQEVPERLFKPRVARILKQHYRGDR